VYVSGMSCIHAYIVSYLVFHIQLSQRDILNSIDREMSGDLREGFKTVGKPYLSYLQLCLIF